jgi:hypothetical protein
VTVPRQLVVPGRFNGPPDSANGGYVAGLLAEVFHSAAGTTPATPVTVTLRQPPPLDAPMEAAWEGDRLDLTFGAAVLATAERGRLTYDRVSPVSLPVAAEAEQGYAGLRAHPFPTCFVCGPDRGAGDGMGLRPGPVGRSGGFFFSGGGPDPVGRVACTWTPGESMPSFRGTVTPALQWAALDCPSGWASDIEARPMVLGRITAAIHALPHIGDRCVVVARVLSQQGRKTYAASTVYDADGRVLGRAEATWIAKPL